LGSGRGHLPGSALPRNRLPLAGLLVTWLGPSNVLWIDAASFALSAVVIGAAGFRPSALAAATLAQSVGMVMLLLPVLREMDRPSDEAM